MQQTNFLDFYLLMSVLVKVQKENFWVMKYDMYDIGLLGSWTYKRGLELAHHQEMTMHNDYGNDYNEILQGK